MEELTRRGREAEQVQEIALDMSPAFIAAVS